MRDKSTIQNLQKQVQHFVMFVHTYGGNDGTIIFVKTPQYIIEFLLHPIVKIPSPKRQFNYCLFCFISLFREKGICYN